MGKGGCCQLNWLDRTQLCFKMKYFPTWTFQRAVLLVYIQNTVVHHLTEISKAFLETDLIWMTSRLASKRVCCWALMVLRCDDPSHHHGWWPLDCVHWHIPKHNCDFPIILIFTLSNYEVVTTVVSKKFHGVTPPSAQNLSVWSLHALYGHPGFLQHSNDMQFKIVNRY